MFSLQRGPMLIQTLAVCLAATAFAETEFVTDLLGAQIAASFQWPFNHVSTALEDWPADGLSHVWALGKLVACAVQSKPFVQFDGDVLLFKPLPARLTEQRLIAQSLDHPHYYLSPEMKAAQSIAGLPSGKHAFNGGLLGGSDVPLVRAYAWAGLELAQKFRDCPINGTATSMLVEQYQLGVFSERVGVEVGTLLPLHPTREQVAEVGYAHLSGGSKRDPKWTAKAEARLAQEFPEHYARFVEEWPTVARLLVRGPVELQSSWNPLASF